LNLLKKNINRINEDQITKFVAVLSFCAPNLKVGYSLDNNKYLMAMRKQLGFGNLI
jgi:hypothetical protein